MYLCYVLIMIMLAIAGVDVIGDASFPGYVGLLCAVVAGLLRVWREVSR